MQKNESLKHGTVQNQIAKLEVDWGTSWFVLFFFNPTLKLQDLQGNDQI